MTALVCIASISTLLKFICIKVLLCINTLPNVAALTPSQAIVLDTDLTFAADISELWSYFTALREKKKVQ